MQNEAIQCSVFFLTKVKGFKERQGKIEAPNEYKKQILKDFLSIIHTKKDYDKCMGLMQAYIESNPYKENAFDIKEIYSYFKETLPKSNIQINPNNMIKPGVFYYHPLLQETPPPPSIHQLENGEFVSSYDEESFYLVIKESFTYEDCARYFEEQCNLPETLLKRDAGAFKRMSEDYSLDLILYMIDCARDFHEDENRPLPSTVYDITYYLRKAIDTLDNRKDISYFGGVDHVIPKT